MGVFSTFNQKIDMNRLTKVTFMLAGFFALDKALALLRQVIIARSLGFLKRWMHLMLLTIFQIYCLPLFQVVH